jgi:DNA mismatch endonuclease (patch repair protein)
MKAKISSTIRRRTTRPEASSLEVRRRMQATPRRDTPPELALRTALHLLGLRFRVDWRLPGSRRRADLAFISAKVAVFVDGCFWHGCPKHMTWPKANAAWWRQKISTNMARDRGSDELLRQRGWRTIRIWEHTQASVAAARVARVIKRRLDSVGGQGSPGKATQRLSRAL